MVRRILEARIVYKVGGGRGLVDRGPRPSGLLPVGQSIGGPHGQLQEPASTRGRDGESRGRQASARDRGHLAPRTTARPNRSPRLLGRPHPARWGAPSMARASSVAGGLRTRGSGTAAILAIVTRARAPVGSDGLARACHPPDRNPDVVRDRQRSVGGHGHAHGAAARLAAGTQKVREHVDRHPRRGACREGHRDDLVAAWGRRFHDPCLPTNAPASKRGPSRAPSAKASPSGATWEPSA